MKQNSAQLLGTVLLAFCCGVFPCVSASSPYDPLETFAPFPMPQPVNRYRSADGSPGPDFWQNRADYEIHATLDVARKQLAADAIITYTNNSPARLDSLWLQLDQNIYRQDSRAARAGGRRPVTATSGFILDSVETQMRGRRTAADYTVDDTRMQVRLSTPLAPRASTRLFIRYHYEIPGEFGGRTAWTSSTNGDIYDVAQWFPRMAVYDDLRGWDTLPYVGAEFYLEYGTIDYYVTVPWDLLVAGSGALQNPREVLTRAELDRLEQARDSDTTVMIRGRDEVGDPASRPASDGTLTWHFKMSPTRDVAFSASRAFIWDAARINLPNGQRAIAMSFYPEESAGEDAWGRSTEYLKHAVEEYSRRWAVYPYPAAVNVAGKVSGMEYPGLLFDGMKTKGKNLFWLTAHEIGHTWFPMMVGTNERRHAWMDEGLNTFIDVYESDAFDHGVYGPKHDQEYAPGGKNPVIDIIGLMNDPDAPPIMTRPDVIGRKYGHPVSYFKTALGLVLLREQILGPERFDPAFRKFIRDWSWHHPSPSDFFRTIESSAGEDLSWFWRGWFSESWRLDLAVERVGAIDGDPARGNEIAIANLGKLVMPATVEVDFEDGARERVRLPVEAWMRGATATIRPQSSSPITAVTVDPDVAIPDCDRTNNTWHRSAAK